MPAPSYRARWYAERGLPYESAKLGDMPPFKCVGGAYPDQLPKAPATREPGEDTEEVNGETV
jgi:hypothetical protein